MKKLIKNKFFIISISVIILIFVYLFVQKAIDNYFFNTNNDIFREDSGFSTEKNSTNESAGVGGDKLSKENSSQISNDETNLVVEEAEESESDNVDGIEETEIKDTEKIEVNKIYVYITGEVNNPGVVILNEGSRIVDAINAAGGTTSNANVTKVNLVFILEDGMKVNIPNNNDLKEDSDFEYITLNSGDSEKDDYSSNNSGTEREKSNYSKNYGSVNINTATQTELETLPGIGPSLALKIINYRKENGKFSSIDEIKNISGIGESKFENLKKYINI